MELWDAINTRRSIRSFYDKAVEDELLLKLIDAARWAPTAANIQPWHFVLVKGEAQYKRIKAFTPGLCGKPSALIVICTDQAEAEKKAGKLGRDVLTLMDTAMAAQNISLAAVDKGLGTCVIRSFNLSAVAEILQLPPNLLPQLILSVGYPDRIPNPPKRKDLPTLVSWEQYGEAGGKA